MRTIWNGVMLFVVLLLVACAPAVPDPNPGQLLYVTTFDAFNEDWDLYEGELAAQVVVNDGDAALQVVVGFAQSGAFTVLEQQYGDFDLRVFAEQTTGPEDLEAPGFGVVFRHQDNDNFYAFMISGDGYYQVVRRLDGVDDELSDWAVSPAIVHGMAVNQLRVIGQGDTFTFFINDEQVPLCLTLWNPLASTECQVIPDDPNADSTWSADAVVMTLVDDAFETGHIGVGARSFGTGNITVQFDDMLICGPYDTPRIPFICEELAP